MIPTYHVLTHLLNGITGVTAGIETLHGHEGTHSEGHEGTGGHEGKEEKFIRLDPMLHARRGKR